MEGVYDSKYSGGAFLEFGQLKIFPSILVTLHYTNSNS